MRFVSLRMSEDEYERLKVLVKEFGSRSLSSFIRDSVSWILSNGNRTLLDLMTASEPGRVRNAPADDCTIAALGRRIKEFDRELEQLKSLRDRLSRESMIASERRKKKENGPDYTSDQRDEL
jgi:hypothetical protein